MADSNDSQNPEKQGPPDLVTSLIVGAFFSRARVVLWLAAILGVACMFYFGNQNAGSYAGYDAGSIMHPLSYEDTAWTSIFGDRSGMTDDELNDTLSNMRGKYYPGFLAGFAVIVLSVASAAAVGFSFQGVELVFEAIERDPEYRAWLSKSYDRDNGAGSYEHDNNSLASGLKAYAYATKALFMPWADHGIPETSIDEDVVKAFREGFDKSLVLRIHLWAIGTRRTSDGHLTAFLPGMEGSWPSAPAGGTTTASTITNVVSSGAAFVQNKEQSEKPTANADAAKKRSRIIAGVSVAILVIAAVSILASNSNASGSMNTSPQPNDLTQASGQAAALSTSSSSDSDEIADKVKKIKFGSDGTTGTYDSIPDTGLKRVWLDCMPQTAVDGVSYSISKDGKAITLICDYQVVPSEDTTFHDTLAALVDATIGGYTGSDRFFQDGSGTWYQFSESGYQVLYSAGSMLTFVIMID